MSRLLILLSCLFLLACTGRPEHEQKISHDKFVNLITDLAIEEAIYVTSGGLDSTNIEQAVLRNQHLFEKHMVSKADFLETFRFYYNHKPELVKVYDASLEKLTKQLDSLTASTPISGN